MSVKGTKTAFSRAAGINQEWASESGGAAEIKSARIDPSGFGWLFDRGIEPWFNYIDANMNIGDAIPYLSAKMDSMYVWTKQNTGQVFHFFEQGGELFYLWGNNNGKTLGFFWEHKITIDTNRNIPKIGEAGTQYVPFGDKLLIMNGFNKPIMFYGNNKFREFGYLLPTPELELLDVEPSYYDTGSPAGDDGLRNGTAKPSFTTNPLGLGDTTNGSDSVYYYKMTFISDTGSESPLSSAASLNWSISSSDQAGRRLSTYINEVPVGKKGIVARRIYRTKNQRLSTDADSRDQIYFQLVQINENGSTEFIDVIPDTALVNQAPSLTASSVISSKYIVGESWNGRVWLAGGASHPTRIIYSDVGLPEQFGTFSYFDVGNTSGGHITQLFAYYNSLLVFREDSIDIIREGPTGLTVSQLTPNIGTVAANTIQLVPGVGVVFLTRDGFYSISGGLDGGSQVSVVKISKALQKETETINPSALSNAVAVYSKKEKEYWCHYTRRGETVNSRGSVLHSDTLQWSLRGNTSDAESNWYFTAMAVDPRGNIILGTLPTWTTTLGQPGLPTDNGAKGRLVGPQVWSGFRSWGIELTSAVANQAITFTATQVPLPENIYESSWYDFGDGSVKHRVFNVSAEIIAYGDNTIELEWGNDYDSKWNSAGSQKQSKPELVFTTKEDPVFGPANPAVTKSSFTVGTSALKGVRVIYLRWDVNTGLVDNFRFRLKCAGSPFHLLNYKLNFDTRQQLPLNQRTRVQKGQPQ